MSSSHPHRGEIPRPGGPHAPEARALGAGGSRRGHDAAYLKRRTTDRLVRRPGGCRRDGLKFSFFHLLPASIVPVTIADSATSLSARPAMLPSRRSGSGVHAVYQAIVLKRFDPKQS
jgi:hypothetical protein